MRKANKNLYLVRTNASSQQKDETLKQENETVTVLESKKEKSNEKAKS